MWQPRTLEKDKAPDSQARQGGLRTRRIINVILACGILLLTWPVLAIAAVVIYCASPGSVIYSTQRVGRFGRPFTLYKLRTMHLRQNTQGNRPTTSDDVTTTDDDRIVTGGRWIRRLKIDELPQLINIIKGDMSFVGPRPLDPRAVAQYTPLHQKTLEARPGLTSPGTLFYLTCGNAYLQRQDIEATYSTLLSKKLALDIDYVRKRSIPGDIWLLIRTLGAICKIPGAGFGEHHLDKVSELVQPTRQGRSGAVPPTVYSTTSSSGSEAGTNPQADPTRH